MLFGGRNMRDILHENVGHAQNLDEVYRGVLRAFQVLDADGPSQAFLYVSGVITSYGDMRVNLAEMLRRTEEIRVLCVDRQVFAPTCVFPEPLAQWMNGMRYRHEDWMAFWTKILCSGYVGGVVLTPGWERSRGADMEYAIARNLGLAVYRYDDRELSIIHDGVL